MLQNFADAQEQENAFDSISRFIYEGQTDPKFENLGTSRTTLLLKNEVSGLQEAASMNVTPIKEFEGVKAWIEEEAVDAEFKVVCDCCLE